MNVAKVFDAAVFTMIHRQEEGKKPIFDREEIKVFRHDEKLSSEEEEEEEFERRIIRVEPRRSSERGENRRGFDDHRTFSTRRASPVTRYAVITCSRTFPWRGVGGGSGT